MRHRLTCTFALAAILLLGGCQTMSAPAPTPVHGFVTDMAAFDAFIATHPTPAQFRASYPDVQLVMPNTITTMDFRSNNSRYFAELDKDGRIVGGHFG
jgi:hypothetical protein